MISIPHVKWDDLFQFTNYYSGKFTFIQSKFQSRKAFPLNKGEFMLLALNNNFRLKTGKFNIIQCFFLSRKLFLLSKGG